MFASSFSDLSWTCGGVQKEIRIRPFATHSDHHHRSEVRKRLVITVCIVHRMVTLRDQMLAKASKPLFWLRLYLIWLNLCILCTTALAVEMITNISIWQMAFTSDLLVHYIYGSSGNPHFEELTLENLFSVNVYPICSLPFVKTTPLMRENGIEVWNFSNATHWTK